MRLFSSGSDFTENYYKPLETRHRVTLATHIAYLFNFLCNAMYSSKHAIKFYADSAFYPCFEIGLSHNWWPTPIPPPLPRNVIYGWHLIELCRKGLQRFTSCHKKEKGGGRNCQTTNYRQGLLMPRSPPLVAKFLLVSILFPNYGAIHVVRSCWFHSIKKNSARNSYQKLNGCWSIMIHIALILNAELRKVKIRRRKEIFPFTFRTIPSSIRAAFTDAFRTVSAWVGNAANGALPSPNGTPTRWR